MRISKHTVPCQRARDWVELSKPCLVNLPTQDDAASTWPLDEAQKRAHLRMCKKLNLNLIYVATGNHQDAAQFAKEAHEMGISVISKFDLLSKIEKQSVFDNVALGSLSLAQKSAVGFEILSRSSFYSGPADVSRTRLPTLEMLVLILTPCSASCLHFVGHSSASPLVQGQGMES